MRYKHHKRQLIPAPARDEYAQAVSHWLDRACPLYSAENVFVRGPGWTAHIDEAPQFEFCCGAIHIAICPLCPSEMLFRQQTHAKARRELYRIAGELMREASQADERRWNSMYPVRLK